MYCALLFVGKNGKIILRHKAMSAHFLHRKKDTYEKDSFTPSGNDVGADYVRL